MVPGFVKDRSCQRSQTLERRPPIHSCHGAATVDEDGHHRFAVRYDSVGRRTL
jgi:hypothetical protein